MSVSVASPSGMLRRLAVFAPALLTACLFHGSSAPPPAPLRSATRDSLLAADIARGREATRLGLDSSAAAWLDPSVVYLQAGAPIVYGRGAALAVISVSAPARATYAWRPLGGAVSSDGSAGYTFGTAAISRPDSTGSSVLRLDHYIAYWRRAVNGSWRIASYADIGGPSVPSGASVPSTELPATRELPRGARAEAVRKVREADSAFALAADLQGTGEAFADYVAPQGGVFAGPELVTGMAAVRALYDEQQQQGGTLNWRPVFADAATSGDLGMTVGEYVFTGRGANGSVVQRFGKYLTIWQRQPNGDWRFVIDGGNASPTPNR